MRRLRPFLFLAILLVVAVPMVLLVRDKRAIARCVEGGGRMDYATMTCGSGPAQDYVPFTTRHKNLMLATGVIVGLLVVGVAIGSGPRRT